MSELDEGLDEILRKYNFDELLNEAKQAILDLMCKHRGHNRRWIRRYGMRMRSGPCKWCGKEAG